ncbi:hypothetical protein QVD17_11229 [Tagetes erecta]|uniref:Uncharacterized protein n=1 Tax=Tagetes erecta TaxID=13708 RepID=A0AAD8NUQ7_TARER|nr:hypothetical protein QVD17_11229 [Tagetes erecta]
MQDVMVSRISLLLVLCDCPLLKSVSLDIDNSEFQESDNCTITDLFDCLRVVENLSIGFGAIEFFAQGVFPQELPITLDHLKYLCLKDICFIHNYGLPVLALLIKSSLNLGKLKIEILDDSWVEVSERRDSFTLEDDFDVWMVHLNELEITNLVYRNLELDFVKLVLAKSPVLKKVRIFLNNEVTEDEALDVLGTLKQTPHASPSVEVIVEVIEGSCTSSRSVM